MLFPKPRFAHEQTSHRSKQLANLLIALFLLGSVTMYADTVRNSSKAYYGRVQSVGPQGVTLLTGCSGNDTKVIALTSLEEVDFGGPCDPPRLQSSSSPSTAACSGAHGMLTTVIAKSTGNDLVLVASSFTLGDGNVTLTLRSGKQIVGPVSTIQRFYYRDECFRFLTADPVWNSVFTEKTP